MRQSNFLLRADADDILGTATNTAQKAPSQVGGAAKKVPNQAAGTAQGGVKTATGTAQKGLNTAQKGTGQATNAANKTVDQGTGALNKTASTATGMLPWPTRMDFSAPQSEVLSFLPAWLVQSWKEADEGRKKEKSKP